MLLVEDLSQQRLPARTLAAVLQRAGWRVRLAHFCENADAIIALAQRERPRLIILSILFADRAPEHLTLITALRQSGVRAHITLVGPLPSFAAAELLAACPALDSVLCGEAEASVVQLAASLCHSEPRRGEREASHSRETETLRRFAAQGDKFAVPGLACRSPTLDFQSAAFRLPNNPQAEACTPEKARLFLDQLPFPMHDDGLPSYQGYGFATIEASRGCYHACTFCLPCAFYRAAGAPYRLRGVTNVVDEIEELYQRGARLFLFDDEQFLPPGRAREERVEALARELERRSLRIAFTIKCRADDLDAALFSRLQTMGLLRVYVGIESGSQATLDLLGKGVTARHNVEALTMLDTLGLVADFRSLLFHPWSTLETVEADMAFLQSVMPCVSTCFNFQEVEVYPGTRLAARLRAEGRSAGVPWPLSYTIANPRVELLRRLNRLIFGSRAYLAMQDQLTRAWYELLLRQRFQPERFAPAAARQLKATAAHINAASLDVWREILDFAASGKIYDADLVNTRAAGWAGRLNALGASPGIIE